MDYSFYVSVRLSCCVFDLHDSHTGSHDSYYTSITNVYSTLFLPLQALKDEKKLKEDSNGQLNYTPIVHMEIIDL
jgi:hypothetical protein